MGKETLLSSYKNKPAIEQLRTRVRLNKLALIKLADVSPNTYYSIIKGDKPVKIENAGKVLDALTAKLRERGDLEPGEQLDFEDVQPILLSGEDG